MFLELLVIRWNSLRGLYPVSPDSKYLPAGRRGTRTR
jgi:hypothetical protein